VARREFLSHLFKFKDRFNKMNWFHSLSFAIFVAFSTTAIAQGPPPKADCLTSQNDDCGNILSSWICYDTLCYQYQGEWECCPCTTEQTAFQFNVYKLTPAPVASGNSGYEDWTDLGDSNCGQWRFCRLDCEFIGGSYKCQPYGANDPLHPWTTMYESNWTGDVLCEVD
jgi:hypothetical protein